METTKICLRCNNEQSMELSACPNCSGALVTANMHEAHTAMNDALDRAAYSANSDLVDTMVLVDKAFRALFREVNELSEK